MRLNDEQLLAATHLEGPCVVTATPGSGKTLTLTARVIHLIKSHQVNPSSVLCLTFTNKAANEMRERIASRIGTLSEKIWIGTFHRLCVAILRKYGSAINLSSNFTIYDESDQKELLSKVIRMQEHENYGPDDVSRIMKVVNLCREDMHPLDDAGDAFGISQTDEGIIHEYLSLLDDLHGVDFSGLLFKTWQILSANKRVCNSLSSRFNYVLVDEVQDTNTIQYEILRLLCLHNNLFLVGDISQSIFGWRSARPENLQLVKNNFDHVREITLPRNYRSKETILKHAQSLIRCNPGCVDVNLISERGIGGYVGVKDYENPFQEAEAIADHIYEMNSCHGHDYKNFAILYRTNSLSKSPEMALRSRIIPYRIIGGFSFFDRAEIKTSLAYLSFFCNPYDTISFARAISSPPRRIGQSTIGRIERFCLDNKVSVREACSNDLLLSRLPAIARQNLSKFFGVYHDASLQPDVSKTATHLLVSSGFYGHMQRASQSDPDYKRRVSNIDELLGSIDDFALKRENVQLSDYIQSVQLLTDESPNDDTLSDAVSLLTIHNSKGLEFPSVFIIGAEDHLLPHFISVNERGNEAIEEERRLLYVGMTRAKDNLLISYCRARRRFDPVHRRNTFMDSVPSRFIEEFSSET